MGSCCPRWLEGTVVELGQAVCQHQAMALPAAALLRTQQPTSSFRKAP